MGNTRDLHLVPPPSPGPREVAALAGRLAAYARDLCEDALPGHTAVMLLRDAVVVLDDEDEDEIAHAVPPTREGPPTTQ